MKSCAFLTMENRDGFFVYDQLAFEPLADLGWSTVEIPWTDSNTDWNGFDAVVIRSTWDYQQTPSEFLAKLEAIERSSAQLFNPHSICRWNLNKTYLQDLENKGVPIIPSVWPNLLNPEVIGTLFQQLGRSKIVVKPLVGANADDTFVLHSDKPSNWTQAVKTFRNTPAIAQPFIESICEHGETSLFYFGGEYSHAVLKTPMEGDFRVQEEHGGQIKSIEPERSFKDAGDRALEAIPDQLLYARIDLVTLPNGSPAVIEVELIEPSLYFEFDPQSPCRFAEALDSLHSANS